VTPTVAVHRSDLRSYSNRWWEAAPSAESRALRELSRLLSGTDNLFAGIVEPGMNVVVKPNWVIDRHPRGLDEFSIITHSAVLSGVVELVHEALDGTGSVTIADAPQWNCDFENLLRITQVESIPAALQPRGLSTRILDLRQRSTASRGLTRAADRKDLAGDPAGYVVVDLGEESAFVGMPHPERIYGADYDRSETVRHHSDARHEYLISKTVLDADVVVHVPKLKTHKRVGVTLNAKGMVGINGDKNWIAHFRVGPPSAGGDEYPDELKVAAKARNRAAGWAKSRLLVSGSRSSERLFNVVHGTYRLLKPVLGPLRFPEQGDEMPEGGNWHGNDTAWRMTADLARVVLFADASGQMQREPQRRFVSIVDGIVAGEGTGPLAPDPKPCGVLIAGTSLLAVDLVATRLMGFDWRKVRSLQWLVDESPQDLGVRSPGEIRVASNVEAWERLMQDPTIRALDFVPHPQWLGHIEI
jgi:uncharacterized protein (DUF362 family)